MFIFSQQEEILKNVRINLNYGYKIFAYFRSIVRYVYLNLNKINILYNNIDLKLKKLIKI